MNCRKYTFLILTLLLAACGSPSPSPEVVQESGTGVPVSTEDVPLSELPLVSPLTPEPVVVGPGGRVQIHGMSELSGTLTLTDPAGGTASFDFVNGASEIVIPEDAVDGRYQVIVENEFGALAFGGFQVSSVPGIWLSADQAYPDSQEEVRLTITTYQIPDDWSGVFLLGQPSLNDELGEESDPEAPIDFGAFDGPSGTLVLDADRRLSPGTLPGTPASELTGKSIYLPGRFANTLQIVLLDPDLVQMVTEAGLSINGLTADDGETEGMYFSNAVPIQACTRPGEIHGNLGGAGFVRAITLGGKFPISIAETASGPFALQVSSGKVLITASMGEGLTQSAFEPQIVSLSCGESLEVNLEVARRPNRSPGSADIAVNKAAAPSRLSRSVQGGQAEICRSLLVMDIKGSDENRDAYRGNWTSQLGSRLSRVSVMNAGDYRAILRWMAAQQLLGTPEEESIDISTIAGALGTDFLLSSNVSKIGDEYVASWALLRTEDAAVVYRASVKTPAPTDLIDLPAGLLEAAQKADICGKIDPVQDVLAPEESVELGIEMTDLNGEPYGQVKITVNQPNCGELEWTNKEIAERSTTNQYVANDKLPCTDKLEFIGKATTPGGSAIESRPEESTAVLDKTELWDFAMTLNAQFDESNYAAFNWNGELYITEDQQIKGSGSGTVSGRGGCTIIENEAVVFQADDLVPNGTFDFEIGGSAVPLETEPDRLLVTVMGYSWDFAIDNLPQECTWDLLLGIAADFFQKIALQPQIFLQAGNFQVRAQHGDRMEYPILGMDGTFVVTLTREGGSVP